MSTRVIGLRVVFGLLAAFVVFSGLDQALGGLFSMGWMDNTVYFEVVNKAKFLEADNHHRFLGGVWTGLGMFMLISLTDLKKYQMGLNLVLAIVFLGGLARFSQLNMEVMVRPGVLWAVIVEVVGMPILYVWLTHTLKQVQSTPVKNEG